MLLGDAECFLAPSPSNLTTHPSNSAPSSSIACPDLPVIGVYFLFFLEPAHPNSDLMCLDLLPPVRSLYWCEIQSSSSTSEQSQEFLTYSICSARIFYKNKNARTAPAQFVAYSQVQRQKDVSLPVQITPVNVMVKLQ